jgi:hypothetical protein
MTRIVVHIDRLVLNGFGRADARTIGDALRGELARALADPMSAARVASLGDVTNVHAGRVTLAPDAKPRGAGVSAARAIAKGIVQ